jgi:arylsulfatase A-like enzyme
MRLVLVAILSLVSLLPLGLRADAQQPPDIVVILTDDMRTDDWPMLVDTKGLVGGTWFPNFVFNTPLCCPFRASFQRGQVAHNTGIKRNSDGSKFERLDGDTIATSIDGAGYHTIYVGKYMNDYTKRAPGWDDWRVVKLGGKRYQADGIYATTALTNRAVDAIQHAPDDQPLFLMIGHVAPHGPWKPQKQYANAEVGPTRNHDDADRKRTLLSVDDSTEAIAAAMGSRWADAVVLVTSDNGYLLGEHRTRGKSSWWDEASRCPMLLRAPGIPAGTDTRMTSTVDLSATLLRAAGAEINHPLDGRALQESWQREGVLVESWVTHDDGDRNRVPFTAIKGDDWVYVEPKDRQPSYYLRDDGEQEDRIGTLSQARRDELAAWLADLRDCAGASCG